MYFGLKEWDFDRGGKLMYLGGNGLNCEVEFLDEHVIVYQNTNWSHSEPQHDASGRLVGIVTEHDFIKVAAGLIEERLREDGEPS